MAEEAKEEVLQATRDLLAAIVYSDFTAYEELSDESLTCFEPETQGHLVEGSLSAQRCCISAERVATSIAVSSGIAFHKYFFDIGRKAATSSHQPPPKQSTIVAPHVRMLGKDAAVVCYVRIIQSGEKITSCQETRVWQRGPDRRWRNVHFHRSSAL